MSQAPDSLQRAGLLASLAGLIATLLATAQTRLEFLGNDLEEARERFFFFLVLCVVCITAFCMFAILAVALLISVVGAEYRPLVLGLSASGFFAVGVVSLAAFLYRWKTTPRAFSGCLEALERDRLSVSGGL